MLIYTNATHSLVAGMETKKGKVEETRERTDRDRIDIPIPIEWLADDIEFHLDGKIKGQWWNLMSVRKAKPIGIVVGSNVLDDIKVQQIINTLESFSENSPFTIAERMKIKNRLSANIKKHK